MFDASLKGMTCRIVRNECGAHKQGSASIELAKPGDLITLNGSIDEDEPKRVYYEVNPITQPGWINNILRTDLLVVACPSSEYQVPALLADRPIMSAEWATGLRPDALAKVLRNRVKAVSGGLFPHRLLVPGDVVRLTGMASIGHRWISDTDQVGPSVFVEYGERRFLPIEDLQLLGSGVVAAPPARNLTDGLVAVYSFDENKPGAVQALGLNVVSLDPVTLDKGGNIVCNEDDPPPATEQTPSMITCVCSTRDLMIRGCTCGAFLVTKTFNGD